MFNETKRSQERNNILRTYATPGFIRIQRFRGTTGGSGKMVRKRQAQQEYVATAKQFVNEGAYLRQSHA